MWENFQHEFQQISNMSFSGILWTTEPQTGGLTA